jgi:hypothetical protein
MLKKCVVSSLTAALRFDADLNGDVTSYPLCAVLLRHLCRERNAGMEGWGNLNVVQIATCTLYSLIIRLQTRIVRLHVEPLASFDM